MKTWKHIFQEVIDPQNLREAVRLAARDKGDMPAVLAAKADIDSYADSLSKKLENFEWLPPKHKWETINDGIKKKPRDIVKPPFEEQVVHHAVILAMKPIIEHGMYEYTCGSVPGRGPSYGKKYLERWIRNHPDKCRYALKMDIRHFFKTIVQEILMQQFERVIDDIPMICLLYLIIICEKYPDTGRGIPIGFYTSQWFSNFYLQGLDHFIKEQLGALCYVRYADDMVILGPSKRKLHKMRLAIVDYLTTLGLEMKDDWQVFKFEYISKDGNIHGRPIDFMGFEFHRDHTILRESIYFRGTRKARKMRKGKPNWYNACQMISYCGSFSQADCHKAFEESVKPYVNPKTLKRMVSEHDRRKAKCSARASAGAISLTP